MRRPCLEFSSPDVSVDRALCTRSTVGCLRSQSTLPKFFCAKIGSKRHGPLRILDRGAPNAHKLSVFFSKFLREGFSICGKTPHGGTSGSGPARCTPLQPQHLLYALTQPTRPRLIAIPRLHSQVGRVLRRQNPSQHFTGPSSIPQPTAGLKPRYSPTPTPGDSKRPEEWTPQASLRLKSPTQ